MINEVSRAFFHARAEIEVFVQLPKEGVKEGEDRMCGRLKCSMYGTSDAAQDWYQECSGQLIKIGLEQGKASPCVSYSQGRGVRTHVHGDDYVSAGKFEQLQWMRSRLGNKYTAKT